MKYLVALILLLLVVPTHAERVKIKWTGDYEHNSPRTWSRENKYESGWSRNFQNGAPEEGGKVDKNGELNGLLLMPKNVSEQVPFVVLMHPCGGLDGYNTAWIEMMADKFNAAGFGVIAPDSYSTRSMAIKCGSGGGIHWGYRRGEDAYAAMDYVVQKRLARPESVFVVGYSNGGLSALAAMFSRMKDHPNKFAAGFAIVPHCGPVPIKSSNFYNPVVIFSGDEDTLTPARYCEELGRKKRSTPVQLVILKGANHGFMFDRAPAVYEGVKYSYNIAAAGYTIDSIINAMRTKQFVNSTVYK